MADETTNFKGVMMCNRPGEALTYTKDRPFISRVDPKEPIGLNPVTKTISAFRMKSLFEQLRKGKCEALINHKRWLEEYKEQMRMKKEAENRGDGKDSSYYERIREAAARDRERTRLMKEEYNSMRNLIDHTITMESKPQPQTNKLTASNLQNLNSQNRNNNENPQDDEIRKKVVKGNDIPKWAYTNEGNEVKEEEECDGLLDFIGGLDYQDYINDFEVKSMVNALKKRIIEIQKDSNGKPKANLKREVKEANKEENEVRFADRYSVGSNLEKSIKEIQEKMNKPAEWDSTSGQLKAARMEERVVKHVADEVLRNHTVYLH